MQEKINPLDKWKPQQQFCKSNPQFEPHQISYAMRQRHINGLDEIGAVRRFGRKLYIHEGKFALWFEDKLST